MEENFKLEIISPEKRIFSGDTKMVVIPSYEGDMSILKNHISIITFLRPGIVKVQINENNFSQFFVEDGTVELSNNSLLILSSTVKSLKQLSKNEIDKMIKESDEKIKDEKIKDKERYALSYKIEALKEIRQ